MQVTLIRHAPEPELTIAGVAFVSAFLAPVAQHLVKPKPKQANRFVIQPTFARHLVFFLLQKSGHANPSYNAVYCDEPQSCGLFPTAKEAVTAK